MREREENQMAEMPIYENVEKIAQLISAYDELALELQEELGAEGIVWRNAEVVTGLNQRGRYLYDEDGNRIAENGGDCFVYHSMGSLPIDYYDELYFRTKIEGLYLKVICDEY